MARDLAVQVAFNPATVAAAHLLGYDAGASAPPAADDPTGSIVLPGQAVTALYEIEPAPSGKNSDDLLALHLRYRRPNESTSRVEDFSLRNEPRRFAEASVDFRFSVAVAALGLVLQRAPEAAHLSLDQIGEWGRDSLGDDSLGYRGEFLTMVAQAKAAQP